MEQLLYFVSMGEERSGITLQRIKEEVLKVSCIPRFVKKIMRCPQCKRWSLTNQVFCEKCSKNLTKDDDWSHCVLSNCRCNCNGNKEKWKELEAEERRNATCAHFSKQPTDHYVLFIPPEAIIADYLNMEYTNEMVGLKEDQIKKLAEDADACGFHHILLTENSKRIYEAMGFSKAAEAVGNHLSRFQNHDSMTVLSHTVDEAIQSGYYESSDSRPACSPADSSVCSSDSRLSQKRPHPDRSDSSVKEQFHGTAFVEDRYFSMMLLTSPKQD